MTSLGMEITKAKIEQYEMWTLVLMDLGGDARKVGDLSKMRRTLEKALGYSLQLQETLELLPAYRQWLAANSIPTVKSETDLWADHLESLRHRGKIHD